MQKLTITYLNTKGKDTAKRLTRDVLPLYWNKPSEVANADKFDGDLRIEAEAPDEIRDRATIYFTGASKNAISVIYNGLLFRRDTLTVELGETVEV